MELGINVPSILEMLMYIDLRHIENLLVDFLYGAVVCTSRTLMPVIFSKNLETMGGALKRA